MSPDLDDLMTFDCIARQGSLSAAARELDVAKSTVSLCLARLEDGLGLKLIQRSTRRMKLTDAGRALLLHTAELRSELTRAERSMEAFQDQVSGQIRITISTASGHAFLPPLLSAFSARYPAVEFQVELNDEEQNLIETGIDLAFRTGQQRDSNLISRRLLDFSIGLYASKDLIERLGVPEHPGALVRFPVVLHQSMLQWSLKRGAQHHTVTPRAGVQCSSLTFAHRLVREHQGIAALPSYLCAADVQAGRLQAVLPEWGIGRLPFSLTWPARMQPSRAVATFVDFTIAHFTASEDAAMPD